LTTLGHRRRECSSLVIGHADRIGQGANRGRVRMATLATLKCTDGIWCQPGAFGKRFLGQPSRLPGAP
jgi:hypothetical protein